MLGIDVSLWRGDIDWQQVASIEGPSRVVFATLKASHGVSGQPGLSEHWLREAPEMKSSGIPLVGGCHRLLPGNAEEQAGVFLDAMRAGLGTWRGHLVQLDCEAADAQTIREWLRVWRLTTEGYPVLGYLPDWREGQWAGSDLATYDFAGWWASEYVPGEGSMLDLFAEVTADTWHRWDEVEPTILQFTGKASVPGVPGLCDVNAYRGTLAELRRLATGS